MRNFILIVIISLSCVIGNAGNVFATATEKRYVQAVQTTPLYDLRAPQEPYQMAKLLKGAQIEITSSKDERFYEVPWGKQVLYVEKAVVQEVNKPTFKNVAVHMRETTHFIIPKTTNTYVYERPNKLSAPFAMLSGDFRYAVAEKIGDWYVISLGGRKGYIPQRAVYKDQGVPVLVYHHILQQHELGIYKDVTTTVTTTQFEEQMNYLAQGTFQVQTLQELISFLKGERTLPVKSVIITFDDGLLSSKHYAYPVLKKLQMQATQYVISYRAEIARHNELFDPTRLQYISLTDLLEMNDVFTFEAHTYNLHNWLDNESELISVSRETLTEDLMKNLMHVPTATSFSYPFGRYTEETMEVIKHMGFQSAVSTKTGYNLPGDDLYQLKRQGPNQQTTLTKFEKMVFPYE